MSSFAIGLKRGRRRPHAGGLGSRCVAQPQAVHGFSGDEDSGDEKPRGKSVSHVGDSPHDQQKQIPAQGIKTNGEKGRIKVMEEKADSPKVKVSQIARLVERRKDAERELQVSDSVETKDEALFRYDVERCSREVSLQTYQGTPVDGFGAAMLRSMGWRGNTEKKGKGSKDLSDSWRPKPRPSRLGLGAKLHEKEQKSGAIQKKNHVSTSLQNVKSVGYQSLELLKGTQSEEEQSSSPKESSARHAKDVNQVPGFVGEGLKPNRRPSKRFRFTESS
ncbi:unnamed protein product [Chondrus crispus]|uniref:Spp2/MOS2 G-patch domain-containing protein n=1 Tax=Chondrus crispus TaxID=2769 RepID=R7QTE2_CHOCR|nr:unnamed protein product [Chondrus crispus]CDF40635.1 unnamed protein product [Chondrus crispus]|eukprot:XP_005710929.1 unnamed protein product [Chondrus crispus]